MSIKIKGVSDVPGQYMFYCIGCEQHHAVYIQGEYLPNEKGPRWTWNGSKELPTFSPSILIQYHIWTPPVTAENHDQWKKEPWEQKKVNFVCHTFIRDGNIQYLGDCTHKLAGQTIPLPDID